jgi:hypothetical protein
VEERPVYAPELNPEEFCQGNVKHPLKNAQPKDKTEMRLMFYPAFLRIFGRSFSSNNGYSQVEQELKEQILRAACTLLGQTGEFLTRSEWMEWEIQINQSCISYAQWEHRREKVNNKLLQNRRRFAVIFYQTLIIAI